MINNKFKCIKSLLLLLMIGFSVNIKSENNHEFALQDNKSNISYFTDLSYVLGGKITHRTIVYRSGLMPQGGILKNISNNLSVGGGTAVVLLEDETFIPLYAKLNANFRQAVPSYYASFKIGYSYASNYKYNTNTNYTYRGGIFSEQNFGYKFNVNDNIICKTAFKVFAQFGNLEYKNPETNLVYDEILRFLLIGLSVGFEF